MGDFPTDPELDLGSAPGQEEPLDAEPVVSDVAEVAHFRARLDRAAARYREFGEVWAAYLGRRPHRFVTSVDAGGHGTLRLERVEPLPEDLALILGEFCYQMRAALDNCLYAVAVIASDQNPLPGASGLQWPICESAAAFEKQRWRLKHLPARVVESLESIQPYQPQFPSWTRCGS